MTKGTYNKTLPLLLIVIPVVVFYDILIHDAWIALISILAYIPGGIPAIGQMCRLLFSTKKQ